VAERLGALGAAFEVERDLIADSDQVRGSLEHLAGQLGSDAKPNRLTVMSILRGIAESATAATGVVTAAEQLKQAVERLF
jgi:hypothetical protein